MEHMGLVCAVSFQLVFRGLCITSQYTLMNELGQTQPTTPAKVSSISALPHSLFLFNASVSSVYSSALEPIVGSLSCFLSWLPSCAGTCRGRPTRYPGSLLGHTPPHQCRAWLPRPRGAGAPVVGCPFLWVESPRCICSPVRYGSTPGHCRRVRWMCTGC